MNPELERLVRLFDKSTESTDEVSRTALEEFEREMDAIIEKHPGVPRDRLRKAVIGVHRSWLRQERKKPLTIPPRA
jgi:hypothetical protein